MHRAAGGGIKTRSAAGQALTLATVACLVALGAAFVTPVAPLRTSSLASSAARRAAPRAASTSVRMGTWGTREWNWGYASGGAHDAAAVLRRKLSQEAARAAWLEDVLRGEVGWEEVKLALALKWQRAARERRDGGAEGYGGVLAKLVEGGYEGVGGDVVFVGDMESRLGYVCTEEELGLVQDLMNKGPGEGAERKQQVAARVLMHMAFVPVGL